MKARISSYFCNSTKQTKIIFLGCKLVKRFSIDDVFYVPFTKIAHTETMLLSTV